MDPKRSQSEPAAPAEVIPVFVMGKRYDVPSSLTIQKALEYAGYALIRGCGCRGGACGACATVYRLHGSYTIEVGLACQTVVQPNMYIAQIPFFPAEKARYDASALEATAETLGALYPDLYKCMGCNTCTKSCPMDIPVMEYIAAALRGDLETVAELSFSCVMCGLCTARCPAELRQYHIAELARRLVALHVWKRAEHLARVVDKCASGYHAEQVDKLLADGAEQARKTWEKLYVKREIEPMDAPEDWEPRDKTGL